MVICEGCCIWISTMLWNFILKIVISRQRGGIRNSLDLYKSKGCAYTMLQLAELENGPDRYKLNVDVLECERQTRTSDDGLVFICIGMWMGEKDTVIGMGVTSSKVASLVESCKVFIATWHRHSVQPNGMKLRKSNRLKCVRCDGVRQWWFAAHFAANKCKCL